MLPILTREYPRKIGQITLEDWSGLRLVAYAADGGEKKNLWAGEIVTVFAGEVVMK